MSDELRRVLDAAMVLPAEDRAKLAALLAASLGDGDSPSEVQAAWIEEAKRRAEAIDRGELALLDSDEVMARLRARVRRANERRASVG